MMVSLRACLPRLAALWLALQIGGMIAAPIAVAFATVSSADHLCTCPAGGHQTCPMHHGGPGGGQSRASRCVLRNAGTPGDGALLSFAGGVGVMPATIESPLDITSVPVVASDNDGRSRRVLPDSPPPRS